MTTPIIQAIEALGREKGIDREIVISALEEAMSADLDGSNAAQLMLSAEQPFPLQPQWLNYTRMIAKAAVVHLVRDATMTFASRSSACASESAPRTRELAACPKGAVAAM